MVRGCHSIGPCALPQVVVVVVVGAVVVVVLLLLEAVAFAGAEFVAMWIEDVEVEVLNWVPGEVES